MSDRTDRSERLRRRFDRPGSADEADGASGASSDADESAAGDTAGQSETAQPQGGSVKERPSTLMYLPSDIDRDLDLTFDEVNLRYRRAFDEKLEKNRDYYPLVATYGLQTLREWDAEDVREALTELRS